MPWSMQKKNSPWKKKKHKKHSSPSKKKQATEKEHKKNTMVLLKALATIPVSQNDVFKLQFNFTWEMNHLILNLQCFFFSTISMQRVS